MSNTMSALREQEYMTLAPGVGIIPERYRNRGYDKLDFGPGEGGLSGVIEEQVGQAKGDDRMDQFLAAIAAGADAKELASGMLATRATKTTGRGRRGQEA